MDELLKCLYKNYHMDILKIRRFKVEQVNVKSQFAQIIISTQNTTTNIIFPLLLPVHMFGRY